MRNISEILLTTSNVTALFTPGNLSSHLNEESATPFIHGGEEAQHGEGHESSEEACEASYRCEDGIFLPVWLPDANYVHALTKVYRAVVYLLALAYLLYGVNIVTDRMVSCIEVIIAQKKVVRVKLPSGEVHTVKVPIWHPVVATLTVYVIGASAAEIFLPTIEIATHHFVAHSLGSSIIFGSGAYHLFAITGLCLSSVKETSGKPIEDLRVFFVTTSFAIFAYLWMFFLVDLISPGEITLWEALATLAFFPLLVITAWLVEKRFDKTIMRSLLKRRRTVVPGSEDVAVVLEATGGAMLEVERRRRLAELLKQLKTAYPDKSQTELEEMAQMQMLESLPKGAAFYRMQASKAISGSGEVISKDKIKKRLREQKKEEVRGNALNPNAQLVGFDVPQITVMESCGSAMMTVRRSAAGVDETFLIVDYSTVAGTAKPVEDYEETKGTLEFQPGIAALEIGVKVIDDDEFEEDKEFKVLLSNPRLSKSVDYVVEFTEKEITVRILDDDHCGVFHFEGADTALADNVGTGKIKVMRSTGARGRVKIPFQVTEGSAREGPDYKVPGEQFITFENDQFEGFIDIEIVDANRTGEIYTFFIELGNPMILTQPPQNPLGNPVLGEITKVKVGICEDNELSEALNRLLCLGDIADLIKSTTWKDQFVEAFAFKPTNHDEGGNGQQSKNCQRFLAVIDLFKQYLLYALSLPWKFLSATVPPPRYLHGWLAFILLLVVMAFLSALIGDLATAFGCTIGLKDTVTAITLVAFGMGLPDTFASRHAAMREKTSDAAIGHITGSNAVNVFLGIGMSWTVAAGYHTYNGTTFTLHSKNMGFIVAVYCALSTAALILLMLRRLPPIRGELGGPPVIKYVSAIFFLILWITFVLLLTLQSYCFIEGF